LSSSREEGYTFAVLEAAYCNCMLIVSAIGGNPQDIPFSEKYNFDDIIQLKILINKILNIPKPELSKIRKVQKEYVEVTYDLDNWAKRIIENYLMISN
jgi:glycosyltransferase involved in cell wall biosynthesis